MTDSTYWLWLGPVLVIAALLVWVITTRLAAGRRSDDRSEPAEPPPRGDVSGGVIRGEASTVSRRDEAPRHDQPPRRDRSRPSRRDPSGERTAPRPGTGSGDGGAGGDDDDGPR